LTFDDLAKYYQTHYTIEPKHYNDRKVSGLCDYERRKNIVKMFCTYFRQSKVRKITYDDLLTFRTARLKASKPNKQQRSLTIVNRELACLRRMFNIALHQDWIIKNPFNGGESLIEVSAE
jgi:site-specific recombinase XerD